MISDGARFSKNDCLRNKFLLIFGLLLVFAVFAGSASAFNITEVRVNNKKITDVSTNQIRDLVRDGSISVRVDVKSDVLVKNAVVEVARSGLEHDSENSIDNSGVFDMTSGVTYSKNLQISLSKRMQKEKAYRLRVRVVDQNSPAVYADYFIYVDSVLRTVEIKDSLLSPESKIVAGEGLLVEGLLRNYGSREEDSVKFTASIPGLGLSSSVVTDSVAIDKDVLTAPVFLKIPKCAKEGTYDVVMTVTYDDGDKTNTATKQITVVKSDSCTQNTVSPVSSISSISNNNLDGKHDITSIASDSSRDDAKILSDSPYRTLLQYSLIGFLIIVAFLVVLVIVKQARKEAMSDDDLLKELEKNSRN